jgi:hypothetical protein
MRSSLLAISSAALCACTPMQWMRDGALPEPAAIAQDATTCRQQAWQEAQYRAWAYRPIAPIVSRDPFGRHFVAWPYGSYGSPFGDPFFEEARLTDFCMRAKGYELVPVEKKAETIQPSSGGMPSGKP